MTKKKNECQFSNLCQMINWRSLCWDIERQIYFGCFHFIFIQYRIIANCIWFHFCCIFASFAILIRFFFIFMKILVDSIHKYKSFKMVHQFIVYFRSLFDDIESIFLLYTLFFNSFYGFVCVCVYTMNNDVMIHT